MSDTQPWRDGVWAGSTSPYLLIVNGTKYESNSLIYLDYPHKKSRRGGKLVSGDFGETPENIKEMTGAERYNMQIKNDFFQKGAVVNKDGDRIYMTGAAAGLVDIWELADKDKLQQLRDDREPLDSPSLPSYYTIQPDKPGKLIWFTGPPGAGKSTSAQLLGRHHGYIYFEGDAFFSFVNPYIDVHTENPTLATLSQKPLKGISLDVIKIRDEMSEAVRDIGNMGRLDEIVTAAIPPVTDFVKQQRKRLGGNMSLAWAIFSRKHRDQARQLLGDDVVFMVLNLTKDCQKKRIDKRHEGSGLDMNHLHKMFDMYEPAGEDEKNTFNVTVTEDMTPDDVIGEVQKMLQKL